MQKTEVYGRVSTPAVWRHSGTAAGCWLQPCAHTLARSPGSGAGETHRPLCVRQHSALTWNKSRQAKPVEYIGSIVLLLLYCWDCWMVTKTPGAAAALFQRDVTCCRRCCTPRPFGVQQRQLMWMLKNWKYQQSSLCATEFPATGPVPAKLAQFKIQTEFLHQPKCVSWTKPTQKLVPGKQSGALGSSSQPHWPSPPARPHGFGPFFSFPMLKSSWLHAEILYYKGA